MPLLKRLVAPTAINLVRELRRGGHKLVINQFSGRGGSYGHFEITGPRSIETEEALQMRLGEWREEDRLNRTYKLRSAKGKIRVVGIETPLLTTRLEPTREQRARAGALAKKTSERETAMALLAKEPTMEKIMARMQGLGARVRQRYRDRVTTVSFEGLGSTERAILKTGLDAWKQSREGKERSYEVKPPSWGARLWERLSGKQTVEVKITEPPATTQAVAQTREGKEEIARESQRQEQTAEQTLADLTRVVQRLGGNAQKLDHIIQTDAGDVTAVREPGLVLTGLNKRQVSDLARMLEIEWTGSLLGIHRKFEVVPARRTLLQWLSRKPREVTVRLSETKPAFSSVPKLLEYVGTISRVGLEREGNNSVTARNLTAAQEKTLLGMFKEVPGITVSAEATNAENGERRFKISWTEEPKLEAREQVISPRQDSVEQMVQKLRGASFGLVEGRASDDGLRTFRLGRMTPTTYKNLLDALTQWEANSEKEVRHADLTRGKGGGYVLYLSAFTKPETTQPSQHGGPGAPPEPRIRLRNKRSELVGVH